MRNSIFTLLCILELTVLAQGVIVDTLKFNGTNPWGDGVTELHFPIVKTDKPIINDLINEHLAFEFAQSDTLESSIEASLAEWAKEGLVSMDFVVSYNKNKILSIQIASEYCAAYCSNWTAYFNFSTETGKLLQLPDILDTARLMTRVRNDKEKLFRNWRSEIRSMMLENSEEFTNEDYIYTMEYGQECEDHFNLEYFELTNTSLIIHHDCFFPHVMLALSPEVKLNYSYSDLTPFLKIKLGK